MTEAPSRARPGPGKTPVIYHDICSYPWTSHNPWFRKENDPVKETRLGGNKNFQRNQDHGRKTCKTSTQFRTALEQNGWARFQRPQSMEQLIGNNSHQLMYSKSYFQTKTFQPTFRARLPQIFTKQCFQNLIVDNPRPMRRAIPRAQNSHFATVSCNRPTESYERVHPAKSKNVRLATTACHPKF